MSETSSTSFNLGAPGSSIVVQNSTFQASGNISVSYTIAGGSAVITLEGLSGTNTSASDWGHQPNNGGVLLDSYNGASVSRSVAVSTLFDSFRVTWKSGGAGVSGSLSTSGPGPTFSSENLPALQNWPA
jgi:hypothetical protein